MSLQVGILGSSQSCSYMAADQSPVSSQMFPVSTFRYWNLQCFLVRMCHYTWTLLLAYMRTSVSSLEQKGRQVQMETRAQWSLAHPVTFCPSQLEHLTSDHWLISHAAVLPTQIIIRLYLESEHSWFSPASLLLLWCDRVFQDAHCCWWQRDALSGSDCPSSVQSRRFDLRRWHISWSLTVEHIFMTNCIILAFTCTLTLT